MKQTSSTAIFASVDHDSLIISEELEGIFDPSSMEERTKDNQVIVVWDPWKFECELVSYSWKGDSYDVRLLPTHRHVGDWAAMICSPPERIALLLADRAVEIPRDKIIKASFRPGLIRLKFRE